MSPNRELNLEGIRRSSRRAALMTLLSGLVVMGSLIFSAVQIRSLDRQLQSKRDESARLDGEIRQKQAEIARLQSSRDALNYTISLIPNTELQKAITGNAVAAQKLPARVYIHIADEGQRKTAEAAAAKLRAAGYIVPGIEYVGRKAPNPTQLRYFQRTDEQGTELKGILQALQSGGLEAHPQYVPPSSGSKLRPGHFELWFGAAA